MSAILTTLQKLIKVFDNCNIPYMIIGGYALPFYGRIRATINLDIAIAIKTEEQVDQLRQSLQSVHIEISNYSPNNPLMIIVDQEEKVEIELWLKPDGITLDNQTLKHRRKVQLSKNLTAWIISPEDLIVNKLARPDRGAVDEQDVKSILTRQASKLDKKYLTNKAKRAGVLSILQAIEAT